MDSRLLFSKSSETSLWTSLEDKRMFASLSPLLALMSAHQPCACSVITASRTTRKLRSQPGPPPRLPVLQGETLNTNICRNSCLSAPRHRSSRRSIKSTWTEVLSPTTRPSTCWPIARDSSSTRKMLWSPRLWCPLELGRWQRSARMWIWRGLPLSLESSTPSTRFSTWRMFSLIRWALQCL